MYTIDKYIYTHINLGGRDRMVVEITNKVVSLNPVHGKVYSIQHYVIKFVSNLRHVGGFLRVLHFPQPIKLTTTI